MRHTNVELIDAENRNQDFTTNSSYLFLYELFFLWLTINFVFVSIRKCSHNQEIAFFILVMLCKVTTDLFYILYSCNCIHNVPVDFLYNTPAYYYSSVFSPAFQPHVTVSEQNFKCQLKNENTKLMFKTTSFILAAHPTF